MNSDEIRAKRRRFLDELERERAGAAATHAVETESSVPSDANVPYVSEDALPSPNSELAAVPSDEAALPFKNTEPAAVPPENNMSVLPYISEDTTPSFSQGSAAKVNQNVYSFTFNFVSSPTTGEQTTVPPFLLPIFRGLCEPAQNTLPRSAVVEKFVAPVEKGTAPGPVVAPVPTVMEIEHVDDNEVLSKREDVKAPLRSQQPPPAATRAVTAPPEEAVAGPSGVIDLTEDDFLYDFSDDEPGTQEEDIDDPDFAPPRSMGALQPPRSRLSLSSRTSANRLSLSSRPNANQLRNLLDQSEAVLGGCPPRGRLLAEGAAGPAPQPSAAGGAAGPAPHPSVSEEAAGPAPRGQAPQAAGHAQAAPPGQENAGPAPAEPVAEEAAPQLQGLRPGYCSICYETPFEVYLACGHHFCLACVKSLKARKLPCGLCRRPFRKWKVAMG